MHQTYRLIIEYDGTLFHGWQKQAAERTVQGELEKAIDAMTGEANVLSGSGRTDAGVHAWGQVAHFRSRRRITPAAVQKGLNSLLPNDIVIRHCAVVDSSFHARYDVISKHYRYRILNRDTPSAIGRQYAWHIRRPLSLAAMQAAAAFLVGSHDFKAFEGSGSPRSHTVRCVKRAAVRGGEKGMIHVDIEADGFLRYMVRNIVGTLAAVGMQKMAPNRVISILESRDRAQAAATAPAHGLFLVSVCY